MAKVIRNDTIQEVPDNDVDVELARPENLMGTNINLIPLQSATQVARLFYGSRFFNQAVPLEEPEAPLVQTLRSDGKSFEQELGKKSGAILADADGEVLEVKPHVIKWRTASGEEKQHELYDNFKFNRKTSITQTPLVKPGDTVSKGTVLARSNFTDDTGELAVGRNAVVAMVPYKGYSMDDAVVISDKFANNLTSLQSYSHTQDFKHDVKGGKKHFASLFPSEYTQAQLDKLDDNGVVLPGTVLEKGDPIILATQPKRISSTAAELGRLSKAMSQIRMPIPHTWDHDEPGVVQDVVKTRSGYHVVVHAKAPAREGDKIVFRSGQKGIVSRVVPQAKMPRTKSGQEIDVLLNPLGIPSRVNDALIYELGLGKAAKKMKTRLRLPPFSPKGTTWEKVFNETLHKAGVQEKEELYDPEEDAYLEAPVTVGVGHVLKLQHMVDHKSGARGNAAYDIDEQPLKGGSDSAQAKRLSGLEVSGLLSSSAYHTLREGATLRGQKNDEYWRLLRQGHTPAAPGKPFVWDKFQALLTGAGLLATKKNGGKLRLGPVTDRHLEAKNPVKIENGELVSPADLSPVKGGLFDERLVGAGRWGVIELPHAVPNPAFEDGIAKLLNLKHTQLRRILAGEEELPPHLQKSIEEKKRARK